MRHEDEQEAGAEMSRQSHAHEQPGDLARNAKQVRTKEASGQKLNRQEVGVLGAAASLQQTRERVEKAPEKSRHPR